MKVKLLNITPNAEEHIVQIARVSSSRKDKKSNAAGLLAYLVRHKHWSPFEHSHATFEIETSKAIGIQNWKWRKFVWKENCLGPRTFFSKLPGLEIGNQGNCFYGKIVFGN